LLLYVLVLSSLVLLGSLFCFSCFSTFTYKLKTTKIVPFVLLLCLVLYYVPSSKALNKKHSWEITHCFIFSTFSFIWVLEVITTVMTSPYPFYFTVVTREVCNLSEVRFGDVAVLKQFSVLHRKNSRKFSVYLLDLRFLVQMPQVISKLSLAEYFLIWATENPFKNRPLSAILFWQISATIHCCLSNAFFLSSFDHETFGEVATVVYALYVVDLSWNLKQKGWFNVMLTLMLLIDLCLVLYEGSFQV
jgi:hypothetical protein